MKLLYSLLGFLFLASTTCFAVTAPLYDTGNVLVGANFNDGPDDDMTLILQLSSDMGGYVDEGSPVKYIADPDNSGVAGWTEMAFDDSAWEDGISGVGFGGVDDNTEVPSGRISIWTRYHFDAPNSGSVSELILHADYDDQAMVWLNGVLIFSSDGAPDGDPPAWNATADGAKAKHNATGINADTPNASRWPQDGIVEAIIDVVGEIKPVPDIEVTPMSWNYGNIGVGLHEDHIFTVHSTGSIILEVFTTDLTGDPDFQITEGHGPFSLPPGGTREIVVRFTPESEGSRSADLSITNNVNESRPLVIELQGTGLNLPLPDIVVEPGAWDYGELGIGLQSVKSFTISNPGSEVLEVYSADLTDDSQFHIIGVWEPFTLNPGNESQILVSFAPTMQDHMSDTLVIESNVPGKSPLQIQLSGTGVSVPEPDILVTPLVWDFGDVPIGGESSKEMKISNPGGDALEITEINMTNDTDFSIDPGEDPLIVSPGGERSLMMIFSPISAGEKRTEVSLINNVAGKTPLSIDLSGNAIVLPPVAVDDDYSVDEDSALTIDAPGVLINDTNPGGEPLTATKVSDPPHGILTLGSDGSFTYIPDLNYNGTDSFTYKANNDGADSNIAVVNITVVLVNDPPVVSDIPDQDIDEGGDFAAVNLDEYVSDPDNEDSDLTWTFSGNVDLLVSIGGDRVASVTTPNPEWSGSETIAFTATDPDGLSASDTATFRMDTVNDPPVVSDIPDQDIGEGEAFAPVALDGYVSDPDDENSDLTWTFSGNVDLSVSISDERVASFTVPTSEWSGSETITFTATDPGGLSDSDTATFRVNTVNDPPVVSNIPDRDINEGGDFATIALDEYVSDPDNEDSDLTWTFSGNTDLSVSISNDRVASVTVPTPEWNGSETVTFTATDPGGLSASDTVTFKVNPVNDPPVVSDIPSQSIEVPDEFSSIKLDEYVSDPDDEDSEMVWEFAGNTKLTISISEDRVANITLSDTAWSGSEEVTFTATDPGGLSSSKSVTFTVTQPATSVDPEGKALGTWGRLRNTALYQNYPNPFNPETWIPYQLAEDTDVTVNIRNISGQLIRTLELGYKSSGFYTDKSKAAYWDGTNEVGEKVVSGIYYYSISAGDFSATRKMVVTK